MRVSEACVLTLKNKSHSVTAEVDVPKGGAKGVIITQGGSVGGWTLYVKDGKLKYCYNFFGIEHYFAEADAADPGRQAPGPDGVQVRRRRPRQGRRRHALLRRQGGRQRPGREDPADGLLRRRGLRRRQRYRLARLAGLRPDRQRLHRRDCLGADRHRRTTTTTT